MDFWQDVVACRKFLLSGYYYFLFNMHLLGISNVPDPGTGTRDFLKSFSYNSTEHRTHFHLRKIYSAVCFNFAGVAHLYVGSYLKVKTSFHFSVPYFQWIVSPCPQEICSIVTEANVQNTRSGCAGCASWVIDLIYWKCSCSREESECKVSSPEGRRNMLESPLQRGEGLEERRP